MENIHRHRAAGEPVALAAEKGTQELLAAVVGSTLTTVVVFVPLGLLEGVVGQFFAALSLTLAAAVLLSLAYALLFIPNAATRFLQDRREHTARLGWLTERYRSLLQVSLRRPRLVAGVTLAFAVVGALLYFRLETGFLPEMDEGGYVIDYWTPEGTSLAETDRMVHRIEEVVAATPEVAGFARRTGAELGLFATEQNRGDIVVKLKPPSARKRNAEAIIEEQRAAFAAQMPGMTIEFMQLLQDMLGDLEGNPEPVEVKIFGDDLAQLGQLAARTAERLKKIPGLVDLVVPQRGNPEVDVRVDPTRAARVGFTVEEVAKQLSAGLLGRVATSFRRGDRLIDVRVRFPDARRFDLDWIREFPLTTASGEIVPLSTTSTIALAQGETQLFREDLKQMVPVTARLEGRDLGGGVRDVEAALRADPWPVGNSYRIGGLFESQQASFRSMVLVLGIAVLLVFAVLVAQFRRFTPALVDPLRGAALAGRGLRAAAPDRDAAQRVLVHGPDPADRAHRQERDHPGGLRGHPGGAGARPHGGPGRGGDGAPAPHPDDDALHALRPAAAGAGPGLGGRAAEAAGDRRDRRPVGLDGRDPRLRPDDPLGAPRAPGGRDGPIVRQRAARSRTASTAPPAVSRGGRIRRPPFASRSFSAIAKSIRRCGRRGVPPGSVPRSRSVMTAG